MSTGHGHIERAVLKILRRRRNGSDALTLAQLIVATDTPTRSQTESVRRGLRDLHRQRPIGVTRAHTVYRIAI